MFLLRDDRCTPVATFAVASIARLMSDVSREEKLSSWLYIRRIDVCSGDTRREISQLHVCLSSSPISHPSSLALGRHLASLSTVLR